jgi:peptidoglycan/LPS O-acetylase OafA/YrhL
VRIVGFDGIRGIGALMVVACHLGLLAFLKEHGQEQLFPLFGYSWLMFFYALSGFLITALLLRERDETGTISLKHFLIRRALKLYPLYYFVLMLMYASGKLGFRGTSKTSLIYAGLYLYNFIPRSSYDTWIGAFHSLAVEEHFYLVLPLMMLLFWRRQNRWSPG